MPPAVIDIQEKFALFSVQWSPRVIAEINDYQVKLARLEGPFVWHRHADTDELFQVIRGSMEIAFRDGVVSLREGQLCVVPKGVEHCPRTEAECLVMIIEPRGVVNTGDAGGDHTAENDVWV
ncbi:MAG: cupin domain-containing protein [Bacteroidetes bacterium]|nr:cupin domain-containing protein [Bacteroidota bacterium]